MRRLVIIEEENIEDGTEPVKKSYVDDHVETCTKGKASPWNVCENSCVSSISCDAAIQAETAIHVRRMEQVICHAVDPSWPTCQLDAVRSPIVSECGLPSSSFTLSKTKFDHILSTLVVYTTKYITKYQNIFIFICLLTSRGLKWKVAAPCAVLEACLGKSAPLVSRLGMYYEKRNWNLFSGAVTFSLFF